MTTSVKKVCYVSGTRADFGPMCLTLKKIQQHPSLHLDLIVTGTHLAAEYGETVSEITAAGLPVSEKINLTMARSGAAMARNIAAVLSGCVAAIERLRPDIVLLFGDRGEMLGAALAAIHLNVHIAHIHGGERSGTIDEPVRHAISKLAHFHFVATQEARDRLIRMGEREDQVFVTGAPGLDGIEGLATFDRRQLAAMAEFDPAEKLALFVFHPVLQAADGGSREACQVLDAMLAEGVQVMTLAPNSDGGGERIMEALRARAAHPRMRLVEHLPRPVFVSWIAQSDLMAGNSSSGVIEAASFGTPVLNVGSRQNLRQRNLNVTDFLTGMGEPRDVLKKIMMQGKWAAQNVYGDGRAGWRITNYLTTLNLTSDLLCKFNAY